VRFSRFAMVGALCAILSNVAVIVLVPQGFSSLAASVLAFGPVLIIGYVLHTTFTFATPPSRATFLRYSLAMLANFPLWAAALYLFGDLLHVSITLVAPATTVLIFLWNYFAARWAWVGHLGERPLS
jgi:putative flippase GtrA